MPTRQKKPRMLTRSTPSPYRTDLAKLIELASSKYLVGTDISPRRNLPKTIWASISLSNTKSSEHSRQRDLSNNLLENARYPVWYSESLAPSMRFSISVSARLATYFHIGMPPASAWPPRIRDPITASYTSD